MSLKFDIEVGVQQGNDNFHCLLIKLMLKADRSNYIRLSQAFPNTHLVIKAWKAGEEIPDLPYESVEYRDAEWSLVVVSLITLFEAWRDGIFARSGITWDEEPPAIVVARQMLKGE